ncbi:hypothetical protein [Flavobacterium frigidarium]|uniref:hypothetical protein n=1 Tax=Flavobacterium frigidarium TaxID=99286 RepID=UPI0030D77D53|tara:strand:- start:1681 stop:2796 length:1116 start_codon:yes stop_codon:yes gene_type:complete
MKIVYHLSIAALLLFNMQGNSQVSSKKATAHTVVSIEKDNFLINGKIINQGKTWKGNNIEGLLFNSRMVQATFDDENPETAVLWKYPDTQKWSADRNTDEFVAAMAEWKSYGLNAVTINLQGGSPTGYGNKDWINSAFESNGAIKPAYWNRLEKVLKKADELEMVVILGLFYFGQDQLLADEKAVINAVDNTINGLHKTGYKNVLIEVVNECDLPYYDHKILTESGMATLINRVKNNKRGDFRFLVSTSFQGASIPTSSVIEASDYILLHANAVEDPKGVAMMVEKTKQLPGYIVKPIVFNEDDHYEFDKEQNNFKMAIENRASWGFFDFRREGETDIKEGFQSVPVNWKVSSARKKAFFEYVKTIVNSAE